MEEELAKKLAAYKESLTEEERQALVDEDREPSPFPGDPVHERRAGGYPDAETGGYRKRSLHRQ